MDPSRPPRVALWCAVSSKAQAAQDKVSLDDQEAQGREFAARIGGQVTTVYRVAHTRDLIFYQDAEQQMDAYRDLRRDVQSAALDVLWALDVDRLGRDPALQQQVISLVEKARDSEVYLESSPHLIGQKSMGHRYLESVQGVSAAEEQARRVRRHRSGMKGRVERRGLLPGRPPFYLDPVRDDSGAIVAYAANDHAAALELSTRLFLAGHSYAEVARRLQALHHPPAGRQWWHQSVYLLLHSDVPAGIPAWGPFRTAGPSPHVPAIWDAETYAAVLRERERRRRTGPHRQGASCYDEVAFCARCGRPMRQIRHSRSQALCYLRCSGHAAKSVCPEMACHPNYVRLERVSEAVAEFFEEILNRPGVLDGLLARFDQVAEGEDLQTEKTRARASIEEIGERRRRLGHELAAGHVDPAIYRQVDDELLASLEARRQQIEDLEREISCLPDPQQWREFLLELAAGFAGLAEVAPAAEIATLLQHAGLRILCEQGDVTLIRLAQGR